MEIPFCTVLIQTISILYVLYSVPVMSLPLRPRGNLCIQTLEKVNGYYCSFIL